jgi:hypothetical protein
VHTRSGREMAALRVRDIDLGRGRIRVERSASKVNSKTVIGTTKTHALRSVAVSASVLKLLAPAIVGKAPDELLWCRADGQPFAAADDDALVRRGGQAVPGRRREVPSGDRP